MAEPRYGEERKQMGSIVGDRQLLFCDFIEYFHGSQEDFTVTCLFFQQ